MSIQSLPEGWLRFGEGRRWRCAPPDYLCEVDDPGLVPDYRNLSKTLSKMRRVKETYRGRLELGVLDEFGYGLDLLVANCFAESLGSVPSRLTEAELRGIRDRSPGSEGQRLDAVIRHISGAGGEKYLERREPGYVDPIATPSRVSIGSHHVLLSTALGLLPSSARSTAEASREAISKLVCSLPADDLAAARLAVRYLQRAHQKHLNQPPLVAASYNAGSPRPSEGNPWKLVQYGNHIDRWVAYFNTSRRI